MCDKLALPAKKQHIKRRKGENYMNKDPIFHFPDAPFLFLTCRGLVTRLDEEGGGGIKNQMKERFLSRHLEEVERDRE